MAEAIEATSAGHKLVIRVTRFRARLTAVLCLAALGVAGCSAAGTTTGAATTSVSAPARKKASDHHEPRRHRRATPKPHRPRERGTSPPTASLVSPARIQPQPSPGSCHARGTGAFSLPDQHCTPGAIDPRVTQSDIQTTICRVGYTETVRPPESVTEPEKEASLAAYGDTLPLHAYEYDHLIPLELGGALNDPRNLWPQPGGSPNVKDELENRLRELVCSGAVKLAVAQREIASNWVVAYHRVIR